MVGKWTWSVSASYDEVCREADAAGARNVVVRTSAGWLEARMPELTARFDRVYAWRWPAVRPEPNDVSSPYAMDEAARVVALSGMGLAGYVLDAEESDRDDNWNAPRLERLATDFISALRAGTPARFAIGLTAGCTEPWRSHHLPWGELVAGADALYPQSYWAADGSKDSPRHGIHRRTPEEAWATAVRFWAPVAGGKPLIPILGELETCAPEEIARCAALVDGGRIPEAHFYAVPAPASALRAVEALRFA